MAKVEKRLRRMLAGTSLKVQEVIDANVGCGNTLSTEHSKSPSTEVFHTFAPHAVFCMHLIRTSTSDNPVDHQCVVMGGDVEGCPVLQTVNIVDMLTKLQTSLEETLIHQPNGNYQQLRNDKFEVSAR